MKVLQINSVCGFGSTGRIAVDLYHLLEENNHECVIAYGRGTSPDGVRAIKIGSAFDNKIHGLLTRVADLHGFGSKKATFGLIKEIEEFNPDVVHLHNIHGYYLNVEILFRFLKQKQLPVIWTLHDCWSFTGHCAYFDFAGCSKWKTECSHCPQKNAYPSSKLADNSRKNYRRKKELFNMIDNLTIVTPSEWLAATVKESFLSEHKIEVINNGISLDDFQPAASSPQAVDSIKEKYNCKDKFVVLGVASVWEERKGFQYFQQLAKRVDDDIRIVIVGLDPQRIKELDPNMIGISRTGNLKELAEIYTMADVFVNPTLEDNFPTTNIEALACGTPVITFQTGGSPEIIDETCGIVIAKENLEELLNAVNFTKNNPFKAEACLNRAKRYNKSEQFMQYITLYNQIV